MMNTLSSLIQPWLFFVSSDPFLRALQGGLLLLGLIVIFLIFYTLRDILLRTHSLWYQILCLLVVTIFPVGGFLLYLLIRPPRTIKERECEVLLKNLQKKKRRAPKK